MSIIADQVRRVDSQLDRVQLIPLATRDELSEQNLKASFSPRILELQKIIKALSTTSSSSPLLPSWRISALLEQASLPELVAQSEEEETLTTYETELSWLLVSKATAQTYGLVLDTLLEQTIPLNDDIWYWDELLGSYTYSSLYTIQTSPLRLWCWLQDVYNDTRNRLARLREGHGDSMSAKVIGMSMTRKWQQLYSLLRESIQERSILDLQQRVLSPIALCRAEARQNQLRLRRLREMGASGFGMLMDEGLSFDIEEDGPEGVKADDGDLQEWKVVVERSVALMDIVLQNITTLETSVSEFEDMVFASVDDDPEVSVMGEGADCVARPAKLSRRLQHILNVHVPNHVISSQKLVSQYGRPSRFVRYWLPASTLLLSSTTIFQIFGNQKQEIAASIRGLGSTVRDFWLNWVLDPIKQIIGTIHHDKDSEIALMSKESLKGDRDSLERMVVDFAIDHPQSSVVNSPLTEAQILDIRTKVKEGDLTQVLRAYEKDLRTPFIGTIRGDLVRTLLIQVQKTKVDVEVALSGIDALLRSQELVFGFVGLTPGILVCVAAFRYVGQFWGKRRGSNQGRQSRQAMRVLRNINRILTLATPTPNNILSYKDHGLLLCEVHVLRKRAHRLFPGEITREFLEDVADLCHINSGIQAQLQVLERIRWAYGEWLRSKKRDGSLIQQCLR